MKANPFIQLGKFPAFPKKNGNNETREFLVSINRVSGFSKEKRKQRNERIPRFGQQSFRLSQENGKRNEIIKGAQATSSVSPFE